MRVPESLIRMLNPIVHLFLATPLRLVFSRTLLVLRVKGRKTGKTITTPMRFEQDGAHVRCFSSVDTYWWRNVQAADGVELLIKGQWYKATAVVTSRDPRVLRPALLKMLRIYPQDAPYQNIRMENGVPHPDDLEAASALAVMVDFTLS